MHNISSTTLIHWLQNTHNALIVFDSHYQLIGTSEYAITLLHQVGIFPPFQYSDISRLFSLEVNEHPYILGNTQYSSHSYSLDWAEIGTILIIELHTQLIEKESESHLNFLANMSHELRTPLNAVIGMSDLLKDSVSDSKQIELVSSINESGNILLDMINSILDFSKLESKQVTMEFLPTNLHTLFKQLDNIFQFKANAQKISLHFLLDENLPIVLVDTIRLRQILVNLIGNAIKFTRVGGVNVRCRILHLQDEDVTLRFEVEDTGVGIEPSMLENIFDPFVQEDASINRKFGGTGLGLTISKSILHLLNSDLTVISNKNIGSTFMFEITLKTTTLPDIISEAQTQLAPNPLLTAKILVAEDNKTNQKLIEMQFKKMGYEITLAENGQDAIDKFASGTYNIIIMDCNMPIMDGFVATLIIRQQELYKESRTPIIALTAAALKEDKERCIACGMDDYLTKPIKYEQLKSKVDYWLSKEQISL